MLPALIGNAIVLFSADKVSVDDVIRSVRVNEALYANIEVAVDFEARRLRDSTYFRSRETASARSTSTYLYVFQDGLSFSDYNEGYEKFDGTTFKQNIRCAFDGDVTRVRQEKIGNLIRGQRKAREAIPVHTWPYHLQHVICPLSTILGGTSAIRACGTEDESMRDRSVDVEYLGRESMDGQDCEKLRLYFYASRMSRDNGEIRYLWLSRDRNYLAVRETAYLPSRYVGETRPFGVTTVPEWKELKPGVWFPMKQVTQYWEYDFNKKKFIDVPEHERVFTVKKVDLEPRYDISFFRDVSFPAGTVMYEIDGDSITRSYIVGAEQERRRRWWINAMAGALSIIAIVSLGAWWLRRRRQRQRRHAIL